MVDLRACVAKSSKMPSLLMPCSWQSCKNSIGQAHIMNKVMSHADGQHNDLSVKRCRGEAMTYVLGLSLLPFSKTLILFDYRTVQPEG